MGYRDQRDRRAERDDVRYFRPRSTILFTAEGPMGNYRVVDSPTQGRLPLRYRVERQMNGGEFVPQAWFPRWRYVRRLFARIGAPCPELPPGVVADSRRIDPNDEAR